MLSDRQLLFRDYLVKKLGFIEDQFLLLYLDHLFLSASRFKYLGALPEIYEEAQDDNGNPIMRLKGQDSFKEYVKKHDLFVPTNFNILDFLNYEVRIKTTLDVKQKAHSSRFISATDISNYTYCPVSFAISKTFDLIKIESAYLGTDLHEQSRLIRVIQNALRLETEQTDLSYYNSKFLNDGNAEFFKCIKNAVLIYSGHNISEKSKYFKSSKGDFVGQPDYIFKDQYNKYFVVEEKFHFQEGDYPYESKFHANHVNQTISYLHGINEFEIEYGYLIYWKFRLDYGEPKVHACNVKKIIKTEASRMHIRSVYLKLRGFIKSGLHQFTNDERNPKKCANCVSNLLCGHKTGQYSTLKFPYTTEYLKTKYATFPKELKKDYVPDGNN